MPWSPAGLRKNKGGRRPCLDHAVKAWLPVNGSVGLPGCAWLLPTKTPLCREQAGSGESTCCPGADPGPRASRGSGTAWLLPVKLGWISPILDAYLAPMPSTLVTSDLCTHLSYIHRVSEGTGFLKLEAFSLSFSGT